MMPVFEECIVLKIVPFQHCRKSTFGELSLHDTAMNRYRDLVLTLFGMEMRWSVNTSFCNEIARNSICSSIWILDEQLSMMADTMTKD
jgi:hypothetical protein